MKFTILLATIDRTAEIGRLLKSIDAQLGEEAELIVVDQNEDDRLIPLLEPYHQRFPIVHLRSKPGLSRARNTGIPHITGDIVTFPDDDSWYPPGALRKIRTILTDHSTWDGAMGILLDENGDAYTGNLRKVSGPVDRFNVWASGTSCTIFLKTNVVSRVGLFDELLGVGAGNLFGSGEETDYILRSLKDGFRIEFRSEISIHHPNTELGIDEAILQKTYRYGCGMGRVLSKHRYPLWFKVRALVMPLLATVLHLLSLRIVASKLRWYRFLGRLKGLRS